MPESFHVFEPRPGELARAFIDRSEGALSEQGATRYRVVRIGRTVEFEGTRDACIDFVERAWWSVETGTTSRDRIRAAAYATQLGFQRIDGLDGAWHSDVLLTNQVADGHS
ncbi:MAG: hypothetical protein WCC30_00415 [Candidatus Dormiibacterota bacterium]